MATQQFNQFGFHFVGKFNQSEVVKYFGLLNDTNPACNTILGADQYDQALDMAKTAVKHYKNRVIFRHFINKSHPSSNTTFEPQAEDTGRASRMSAKAWWENVGRLYIGTGLTILPTNEDMADDLTDYAKWQAEVMQRAGDEGVAISFGRFSTHNPPKKQFSQLDAMFEMAERYGALHCYSPNVYYSPDNLDGFSYISYALQYLRGVDVAVGEFAILKAPHLAHDGWVTLKLDEYKHGVDLATKAAIYLAGIPVCGFSIGEWPRGHNTFHMTSEIIRGIRDNLTPLVAPPPLVTPLPIEIPPDPPPKPESPMLARLRQIQVLVKDAIADLEKS